MASPARNAGRRVGPNRCRGVTLLEVLIALVVLSIGLLGLAGLQTASLQFNTVAYQRTQATMLANAIVERMRANREAALNDAFNGGFASPPPDCDPSQDVGGTPALDLAAWRNMLACQLPLGNGAVTRPDANATEFTITIQWDDSRGEQAPMQLAITTAL